MNSLDTKPRAAGTIRCAVYTRKSSEEGLDMAFNSLDAQREAGADYIKSQKHQGWVAVPGAYDDGGFSGGSTERPGLQRLLEDIRRGKVDVVVVYKVDRLSRSLADFARLMQVFDEHHVSFVSVTQQFNTTTSMGRLTLNMLLSFAQFEREVTGERIRDKIAATKRKGVWVGGQPPLGYRLPRAELGDATPEDRIVRIIEPEAKLIRAVYAGYLEHGSLVKLAAKLNKADHTTKRWTSSAGNDHGGRLLSAPFLYRVLTNPLYIGKITHTRKVNGQRVVDVHPGKHVPIIAQGVWDKVQANMATAEREARHRWTHTHLLKGRLKTFEGHTMSPASVQRPASKRRGDEGRGVGKGKRLIRYYISQKAMKHGYGMCPIKSVNAAFVDDLVRGMVLDHLRTGHAVDLRFHAPHERDHWIRELAQKVVLTPERVVVEVGHAAADACVAAMKRLPQDVAKRSEDVVPTCMFTPEVERFDGATHLTVRIQIKERNGQRVIVDPQGKDLFMVLTADGRPVPREQLVRAVGLAFAWYRELQAGDVTIRSIARAYGVTPARVHALLPLTHLSPSVLRAVLVESGCSRLSLLELLSMGERLEWQRQSEGG